MNETTFSSDMRGIFLFSTLVSLLLASSAIGNDEEVISLKIHVYRVGQKSLHIQFIPLIKLIV